MELQGEPEGAGERETVVEGEVQVGRPEEEEKVLLVVEEVVKGRTKGTGRIAEV